MKTKEQTAIESFETIVYIQNTTQDALKQIEDCLAVLSYHSQLKDIANILDEIGNQLHVAIEFIETKEVESLMEIRPKP